ncbi:MAG: hypothetical protein V7K35_05020 [Nostoc sp.]
MVKFSATTVFFICLTIEYIDWFIKAYLQQLNHTTSVGEEALDNFKQLL